MAETTSYDASLELAPDGACLAQVLDLPGCFARATSEAAALAALTDAIPDYFAWLQRHDDYTPVVAGPFAVTPRERIAGAARPCMPTGFFTPDAQPVGGEDLDWLLALLGWALADLAGAAHADGALLAHIAEAQVRALVPLAGAPPPPALPAARGEGALAGLQAWTDQRLRAASAEDLARVAERDERRWSARWALRQSILHARWHASQAG